MSADAHHFVRAPRHARECVGEGGGTACVYSRLDVQQQHHGGDSELRLVWLTLRKRAIEVIWYTSGALSGTYIVQQGTSCV